ncbi:MAG: branched-chain amino acid ABC transporter permease [Defluviitaleaceae bacterium]|nr:branched-chain amino acid ABC transporter permease [Defluviitaleaceae bacterium]
MTNNLKQISKHPLFGYVILALGLIGLQLLFMFTDGIVTLTVSRAIAMSMIYTIAAMGLGILMGLAGLASLGTAAFVGLGAYIAANILISFHVPFFVVILAVTIVAIVIGSIIGFISLRVRGLHLLVITLAFATILNELFITPNNFTGGPSGITNVPFPELGMFLQLDRETVYFLILGVMFLLIMLTLNIINSPTGRAMLAMSSSESLAKAMGINVLKYRVLAFVISTIYAMIAGVLFVSSLTAASPASWNFMLSLNLLAAVILGGSAKPSGVIMGCFAIFTLDLVVLRNFAFFVQNPSASMVFSGALIIIIYAKFPGGLTKLVQEARHLIIKIVKGAKHGTSLE